ncbi:unnamed protein product [Dicrocoelium dendriticum]|nr:unnamed protein product [Dicrocoelium dendriticum]
MQLMELSFRRDSWRSRPCNRNCVTDPSWSLEPGSSLPHAANLLNFSYCYPQPSLFPAFQDDGQHHHLPHHPQFSALGQPSTPTLSGTNQHSSMTSLSHQFPPNFNTTVLLGHGPLPGCFNGLYTPNSGQPQTGPAVATSLTAGSLAMAPMSYWHGPPMSQLTDSHPTVAMNRLGLHEDSTVTPMGGSIPNTNIVSGSSPPLQPGNGTAYPVFLSQPMQSQICGMLPDQAAQYVFADFTAPCLNSAPDMGVRDASIPTSGGLRSTLYPSAGWSAWPAGADGNFLNGPPKYGSKQRYSQKHAYHTNYHSSPSAVKSSTGTRCSSRSTVVSVKVSQHTHHSLKCNGDIPKGKGNTGFSRQIIPSNESHDKGFIPQPCTSTPVQLPKKSTSTTGNRSSARTKCDVDLEWPRLSATTPNSLKNKSSPGLTASEP